MVSVGNCRSSNSSGVLILSGAQKTFPYIKRFLTSSIWLLFYFVLFWPVVGIFKLHLTKNLEAFGFSCGQTWNPEPVGRMIAASHPRPPTEDRQPLAQGLGGCTSGAELGACLLSKLSLCWSCINSKAICFVKLKVSTPAQSLARPKKAQERAVRSGSGGGRRTGRTGRTAQGQGGLAGQRG